LQIDISTLAELAERCMAFAKALYYREHEFEYASYKTIQSLISLYTSLGLPESANGLLTFAKQNLKIQMKITDYERLQKWDEALDDYRK
jgi:FKBP12-rapamycin complex-associated protein